MKRMGDMRDPRDGWYSITPGDAQTLVDGQDKNRPLVESRAEAIADAIRDGKWTPNGESIVLTHDGELVDGQHRCRAAIIADKAIVSFVVHLPMAPRKEFFDTIDQGKTRTAADRLALEGVQRDKLAAAIVRLLIQYDRYGWTDSLGSRPDRAKEGRRRRVTVGEIREFYDKNKVKVTEAAELIGGYYTLLRGWVPPALLGFVYYRAAQIDKDKANSFVQAVATGENLTADSPAYQLRKRLQAEALQSSRLAHRQTAALTIKAWNLYHQGDRKNRLSYNEAREEFPAFTS